MEAIRQQTYWYNITRTSQLLDWIGLGADSVKRDLYKSSRITVDSKNCASSGSRDCSEYSDSSDGSDRKYILHKFKKNICKFPK